MNFKIINSKFHAGYSALVAVFLVLVVSTVMIGAYAFFVLQEVSAGRAFVKSIEAKYVAEGGMEDMIYRILTGKQFTSPDTLAVGKGTSTVSITVFGVQRQIRSQGRLGTIQQNLETLVDVATTHASFFYGVQVGEGGLTLGTNSSILGNVYSNGFIRGAGKNSSTITEGAVSAGNNIIEKVKVKGNARSDRFDDCIVEGTATYVSQWTNCSGNTQTTPDPAPVEQFPISESVINSWKSDAEAGGTLSSFSVANNSSASLGPKKITGNLTIRNNATLTLTGTVWVVGSIVFGNNAEVKLSSVYGPTSGILLSDSAIDIGNSIDLEGSGDPNSYLMLLTTDSAAENSIDVNNNLGGGILYAPNGFIRIGNNLDLKEATAYGIRVGNNSAITYEIGLQSVFFSSGPSGGYSIVYWKEVE